IPPLRFRQPAPTARSLAERSWLSPQGRARPAQLQLVAPECCARPPAAPRAGVRHLTAAEYSTAPTNASAVTQEGASCRGLDAGNMKSLMSPARRDPRFDPAC